MRRVTEAARTNKATREELGGSTITVTSLGKLGGIASTPIINAPEVAIIGINRAVERPVVVEWRDRGAAHDESVLLLRSSVRRRLRCGRDDPGAEGAHRAPGDDLCDLIDAREKAGQRRVEGVRLLEIRLRTG